MPQINITTNEINQSGGLVGETGTAFIPAVTDQGPLTGPAYVLCQSLNDYINNFGARSSTSSTAYDWLDEYFHDGGQAAYVTRVTDTSAAAATLTLNDANSEPSVLVTASPGVGGNNLQVQVTRGTSTAITGTTVSGSTSVTSVSSFTNLAQGTPMTATTGVSALAYVSTLTPASSTLTLSVAATVSATQVFTPATFTTVVTNSSTGATMDTHGPYIATSALIADTTSTVVTFAQSSVTGHTVNVPVASGPTSLAGGANASDLTVSSNTGALANFPATLGPGQVATPGYSVTAAWTALLSHASANNRFALLDLPDSSSSAAVVSNFGSITANGSYGMATEGSLILPGVLPNTTRTVASSAAIAALCAQIAAAGNNAQPPAGPNWGLSYPTGFTEYFGIGGSYAQSDVNTMSSAGINCFAVVGGVPCLYGFVTPVSPAADITFWQASAGRERMALITDAESAITPFLFDVLDGGNKTLIAAQGVLQAVIAEHWTAGALYGATATAAGAVNMGPPINTATTEAAGQLNANLQVAICPFANTINESITTVPITVSVS